MPDYRNVLRRVDTLSVAVLAISLFAGAPTAAATTQTSAFTYQGVLRQDGSPMNGTVDLRFRLFDADAAGTQVGLMIPFNAVDVADGLIAQTLDFGSLAFNGEERWLEIGVSAPNNGNGPFTTLAPRQKLTSTPYAAFALNALLPATYANAVNFANAGNAFTGAHAGNCGGLTNLNPANLASGTASINITGSAASATTAGNVSGVVAITNGGTGASNAATARGNLGAAAASHTHAAADIASGNLDIARLSTGGNWALSSNLTLDTDLLFINPTNNLVGIGTTAPGATFDVQRTSSTSIINPVATFRSAGTGNSSGSLRTQNSAGNHFNFGITQGGDFALNYNLNISQASDLLRITSVGNMGLGTLTPAAKLHVNGNLRVDGSITMTTTTRVLSLHASAFLPSDPATPYSLNNNGLLLTAGNFGNFYASLSLPEGATVTAIDVIVLDDNTNEAISAQAYQTPFDGSAPVSMGSASSANASATAQAVNALAAPVVIDNAGYSYHVRANWTMPTGPFQGPMRLIGARVTYTVAQPLP